MKYCIKIFEPTRSGSLIVSSMLSKVSVIQCHNYALHVSLFPKENKLHTLTAYRTASNWPNDCQLVSERRDL